jgi:hypothetical protein
MGAKATPYNRKNDLKQDNKTTKGLTALEKTAFEKADDKHPKVKRQTTDKKIDQKIVSKIKSKRK